MCVDVCWTHEQTIRWYATASLASHFYVPCACLACLLVFWFACLDCLLVCLSACLMVCWSAGILFLRADPPDYLQMFPWIGPPEQRRGTDFQFAPTADNEGAKTTTFQFRFSSTPLIYNCLFHFKFANVSSDFASKFANLWVYQAILLTLQIFECMQRFCF